MPHNTYKTAKAFRAALEARLTTRASSEKIPLDRLRQQAAFDRFLARLFQEEEPDFLLKGGYAMELRLRHRARFSRDMDLTAKHTKGMNDPAKIREQLQSRLSTDMGDWFFFLIGESSVDLDGPPYAGFRFPIEARLDERTFSKFNLDVAAGDAILCDPVWVTGAPLMDFAGIPPARVPLVPSETHFAEKIHAFTLPRQSGFNSRTKDLIDLILLIEEGFPDTDRVRQSLEATFRRRNTHKIPTELPPPHATWTPFYAAMAKEINLTSNPTAQKAFETLTHFWAQLFPKGDS
jgi:predicted nucleotidyltransferase component of viral defense system